MIWQGGGLPLSSTSFAAPLSSSRVPAVPFLGLLEVRVRRPICASTSPTGSWAQLCENLGLKMLILAAGLCTSRGQQQGWASSNRDSLHVGEGSHQERGKHVPSRIYSLLLVLPKRMGSFAWWWSAVIQLSPSEGVVSYGDACKSWVLQSKVRLGSLCGSDGCLVSCLIHPSPRKFLRALYQDEVSQFRVLPFGQLVSQRFFIGVVDAMIAYVRSLGLQIYHCLDIWLWYFRSQTQRLLHWTTRLALIPSMEKSELTPTQDFLLIGTHYRRDLGLMFLPEDWFIEAACHARWAIRARYVTAQDFFLLLGRLVYFSDLVSLGRLRYWLL